MVSGRYRIVAELGRGGMGQVFRAEDTRLGQQVALKFLPPRTAGTAEMLDRLTAEVRIGRGVSHPNVCRIYDIVDTSDGLHFIAMEFVEGEDLASLLRRIGRFTLERGVNVALDICQGLAAAHDQGIIHRDLKPANVMIDNRGRARITDFGLATVPGDARSREIAGTLAYMAPEQFRGEVANVRADLYALGLVLYEMFTGRRLFDGSGASEIAQQHLNPKPAPSSIVRDLPPELDRAILSCLEESPAGRPANARAVAATLPPAEGLAPASGRPASGETPRSRDRTERSIAVLPFEDLGGDGDVFSIGLADEIISDLAKVRQLRVISRGSVMRFRGAVDLLAVGRELQVSYVLNGSILKIGEQLRLNANLVDAQTAEIMWSEKFRGSMADIFDIQETVARTVASQLRAHVSAEESARIAERPIKDPTAWELVLRARNQMWAATPDGLASAEELLKRAESLVGENIAIIDARASVEWHFFNSRIDHDVKRLQHAEELAARIMALDPEAASAPRMRGLVAISRGQSKEAIRHLREAIARDPNELEAAFWLVILLVAGGRTDLGQPLAEHLRQRDPFSLASMTARSYYAFFLGDMPGALQLINLTTDLHGYALWTVNWIRGTILAQMGRRAEAESAWSEFPAAPGDSIFRQLSTFLAAAVRGDRETALRLYRERLELPARESIVHGADVAIGLAAIGEVDLAVDWLENALRRGFYAADRIERSPLISEVIADPKIQEVLERMRRESAALV